MKNLWIIANWKSNKTVDEALDWVAKVGPQIEKNENLHVVVCPTFSCLEAVKKAITGGGYSLMVGSQDLSPFGVGAYTGEEAASLLKHYIELAILGHSERRQNFGETDEMVAKKTLQANENGLIPLVCVQNANTPVPPGVKLVAYEPIFAIGTGNPDTPENAEKVAETLKQGVGQNLEVLYGGSVNSENVATFVDQQSVNGVLIGKASLDPEEFVKIINACKEI